jgi:toxin ParE1/3/4
MRLHWTLEARMQLRAIEAHIAQDSPSAARRTITRLIRRARQAGDLPYSGRQVPEHRRDDLRELPAHPYRIIYRIGAEQVDIVTVWHVRRLLPGGE